MSSLWCFQCGAEYQEGVETCAECDVGLVREPPLSPDEVGSFEEAKVEYDFHEWSYESRRMIDQLLTGAGLLHAWQGASMRVRSMDEDAVDALIEEVEHAMLPTLDPDAEKTTYQMAAWTSQRQSSVLNMLGMQGLPHEIDGNGNLVVHAEDKDAVDSLVDEVELATAPPLDPDAEQMVFEMAEWSPEQQARLANMLGTEGLAHEFDRNGDLVVHVEDEEAVDAVIDRLEDAIARGELDPADVIHYDDDLQVNDLLSDAFDSADRIKGNTHDHEAILEFLESEEMIARLATPYGIERDHWDRVLARLTALRVALEEDAPDDDNIVANARSVRDELVQII